MKNRVKNFILGLVTVGCVMMSSIPVMAADDTYIDKEYQKYIVEVCEDYQICPELIMAVIETESRGIATASNGSCKGLMQVSSKWHKGRMDKLGVKDLYDPRGNIMVGVDYISELVDKYEDIGAVLMCYHGESDALSKAAAGRVSSYASKILDRSAELEKLHNK